MAGGFFPDGMAPDGFYPDGYFPEADAGPTNNPQALYFETRFKAELATSYESNLVTIAGLSGPASSVVANGEQSVNGGAFTSSPVSVSNGDTLQLRQTSSSVASTQNATTATIGDVVGRFVTVTAAAEVQRAAWNRRAISVPRRRAA